MIIDIKSYVDRRKVLFTADEHYGSERHLFLNQRPFSSVAEADETMIIVTMLDSFSHFYNDDYRARTEELGLTIRDVVTIASMIERETNVESEKARISSVIHNRLNLGMIPEEEFPEIPLCSPGKSSIEAALYPSEDENIYYALSDKLDGTHVFTSDENEYNTFVEAYNKARSERDELIKQKKTAREASEDGQKAEDGSETGHARPCWSRFPDDTGSFPAD